MSKKRIKLNKFFRRFPYYEGSRGIYFERVRKPPQNRPLKTSENIGLSEWKCMR